MSQVQRRKSITYGRTCKALLNLHPCTVWTLITKANTPALCWNPRRGIILFPPSGKGNFLEMQATCCTAKYSCYTSKMGTPNHGVTFQKCTSVHGSHSSANTVQDQRPLRGLLYTDRIGQSHIQPDYSYGEARQAELCMRLAKLHRDMALRRSTSHSFKNLDLPMHPALVEHTGKAGKEIKSRLKSPLHIK